LPPNGTPCIGTKLFSLSVREFEIPLFRLYTKF
jgi:hypothetical protein